MLWRAQGAWREARGAGAALLERVALVETLVGILALAAAGLALLALRTRRRTHMLRLDDLAPGKRAVEGRGPPAP
jgi:hypothetical protein